ncbi:MAG: hypothetical protein HZC47_10875 [Methanobacterium sp.]|uniref:hypothetical protein n=1 Tax=Methanobacterium sp. TaxID=2164 RepID=UPI003D64AAB9|nr:hypothetical protein [Methanobacterium sp.]
MEYQENIVAYIDFLGVSSDLMSVEHDMSHLMGKKIMFDAIRNLITDTIREVIGDSITLYWMSDSLILSSPLLFSIEEPLEEKIKYIEDTFYKISVGAGICQCISACQIYFARGGIAMGPMISSKVSEEPFGTGLVRATELEKELADFPRIISSAILSPFALKLKNPINDMKMYVFDINLPFIDYLSFAEYAHGEGVDRGDGPVRLMLAGHAEGVHDLVIKSKKNPTLRGKAKWLLTYHNLHIEKRGGFSDLIVDLTID